MVVSGIQNPLPVPDVTAFVTWDTEWPTDDRRALAQRVVHSVFELLEADGRDDLVALRLR